jgi:hypothetical protein
MLRAGRVPALIQSAWHRRLLVLSVEQLALALSLVLGGGILLLIVGTQLLAWYWLLLLAVAGAALAGYRIRARLVDRYRVAQLLDRRLELNDSLSTAWFLLSRADLADHPLAQSQVAYAERLAAGVRFSNAFPLAGGRAWILTASLAAVAFALFTVRYLVTDSLSFQQSLIPLHVGEVFERVEKSIAALTHPSPDLSAKNQENKPAPAAANAPQTNREQRLSAEEQKLPGKPETSGAGQAPAPQSQLHQGDVAKGKPDPHEGSPSGAQPQPGGQAEQSSSQPTPSQQPGKQQQADAPNNNGVMDRMKDALSGLMAKMRPNNSAKSPQENERSAADQKAGDQTASTKDPNAEAQKEARDQQASQEQASGEQTQGETTEKAQSPQGRSSDQSSDSKSADAQSGVGRQDGDKQVKESEQLKAMGKLAEIIGKRSANVTGDMMVENPSGKQQLKTQYSQQAAQHSDRGGEINRDEIPLIYQQYVREYMQQVRKSGKKDQ